MSFTQDNFVKNFVKEIELSRDIKPSSLSWISLDISKIRPISDFDYHVSAGGTNVKIFKRDELIGRFEIHNLETGMELVDQICQYLPNDITSLAIALAFPLDYILTGDQIDVKIIRNVKGHNLSDILNLDLNQIFRKKLVHLQDLQIINDATSLMYEKHIKTQATAGLILGTGFNATIVYDGQIVNLEAGNFDKFDFSKTTQFIDQASDNPGQQILEKEIAGKYLFSHYNLIKEKEVFETTEEMFNEIDDLTHQLVHHQHEIIKKVMSAMELFLANENIIWAYEGTMLEYLVDRFDM